MKMNHDIKTEGEARDAAMEWQAWAVTQDLSYGEMAEWQGYFEGLAQRFTNLHDEFKENGII